MSTAPFPLLLVEDDSAFRRVYVPLLRDAGFEVTEAADRPSARAALEKSAFPLVLLDLMLPPDGSAERGLEELEGIVARGPGTKVIVVSGVGDVRHMLQAVKLARTTSSPSRSIRTRS